MLPLSTLLPFFGVSLVLGLAPGPDNVFVLLQSAMRGARAGMVIVMGLCTGLLVHTAVVAAGLGALLASSNIAFAVLKTIGATYLAWLGWQAFRAPAVDGGRSHAGREDDEPVGHLYRRGVLMNLTNPKVVIFFLAFLPQFVVAGSGHVAAQIAVLGLVFIAASAVVFSAIAWCAGTGGKRLLESARAQRILNRVAGVVFVLLAVKLASAHL